MADPFQSFGLTADGGMLMRPQFSTVNPPALEPVTLDEVAMHVRVDSPDELSYIEALTGVAREYIEALTGRVAVLSELLLVASNWNCLLNGRDFMRVYRTPLASVTSIKYYAPDSSSLTTISADDYRVITTTEPGMIQFTGNLPSVESRPDAIQITFKAGHPIASDSPPMLRHAIKMMAAHLYENRAPINIGNISTELPHTMAAMITNLKLSGWSA